MEKTGLKQDFSECTLFYNFLPWNNGNALLNHKAKLIK